MSDRDFFDEDLDAQALEEQRAVRALLSSLPDPGPVPPDVLDRITRTLSNLQQEQDAGSRPGRVRAGASVVPLRPRRHRALWLAAAAGLVLVGGGAVVSQLGSDTSASDSTASVGARTLGPRATTSATVQGPAGSGARGIAPESSTGHVYASGTAYRRSDLVLKALALLNPVGKAPEVKRGQGAGPLATAAGIDACLRAVGSAPGSLLVADLATYEGRPAVVLVVTGSSGRQVVVADPKCQPGPAARLTSAPMP